MTEREIFAAALKKDSASERQAFLDKACAADTDLKDRIVSLLDAHEAAGSFLDPSIGATSAADHVAEGPGAKIGRYRLLQQIGEGGMGVVFMAEQQEPVVRKVAVKIIKPGMDTKQVVARFRAEEQALAIMDHPNIARVLDAGATDSGRPFFVMELVKGLPITDYCDRYQLPPPERLDLFLSVCHAVHHAHQKGVIHRDIKPSNILVTLHDGTPVVKVIDFGVAKAINQRLTEQTLFTRFEQMIGTPLYMSPEQAEMSGLDVDTRTDVYSLGVLLYELLTGATPFDGQRLREAAYDEVRRIIREEEPPRPSNRVSTLGETLGDVSAHRKMEPRKLSAFLTGDLDWIVMKSLEKDRIRRYDSAKDFASDIQRHLECQPIEARPPSVRYRCRKYVRRNRAAVAVVSAIAATLFCATGLFLLQRMSALKERTELTLMKMEQLADQNLQEERYDEAVETYKAVWEIRVETGVGELALLRRLEEVADRLKEDGKTRQASHILEMVHPGYERLLGLEHTDTKAAAGKLAYSYLLSNWRPLLRNDRAAEEYEKVFRIMQRAADLETSSRGITWTLLALAEYRRKNWPEALDAMRGSFSKDVAWHGQWLTMAVIRWKLRDDALARDWYRAHRDVYERPYMSRLNGEAAELLEMPSDWSPNELTHQEYVDLYSRLLEDEVVEGRPGAGWIFLRRAEHYAASERRQEAEDDLATAIRLDPELSQVWRIRGLLALQLGDLQAYGRAAHEIFNELEEQEIPDPWQIILCCLQASPDLDYERMHDLAIIPFEGKRRSEADKNEYNSPRLAVIAATCRAGAYEKVITVPVQGDLRERPLAQLFQAIAHKQLGNEEQAMELLKSAKAEIVRNVPTLDGPRFEADYLPDRWGVYVEQHTLLREVQELVDPDNKLAHIAEDTEGVAGDE